MSVNFSDLTVFDTVTPANSGAWLTLLDGQENPTNKQIKLLGANSEAWQNDQYTDSEQRRRVLTKTGKPQVLSVKQQEDVIRKRVAKVAVEWRGFNDEQGQPVPCTYDNVYAVLSHPKIGPLIFEQALTFILDPANYGEAGDKLPNPIGIEARADEIAGN